MKVLVGRRVRVYDEGGNLVEERDATLEDLLDVLVESIVVEIQIPNIGKTEWKFKKKVV